MEYANLKKNMVVGGSFKDFGASERIQVHHCAFDFRHASHAVLLQHSPISFRTGEAGDYTRVFLPHPGAQGLEPRPTLPPLLLGGFSARHAVPCQEASAPPCNKGVKKSSFTSQQLQLSASPLPGSALHGRRFASLPSACKNLAILQLLGAEQNRKPPGSQSRHA